MDYQRLDQFELPEGFRKRPAVYVQLWWLVQSALFATSPQILYGWRRSLLRLFGAQIGQSVLVRPSARIIYPWNVSIGEYSWIGDEVVLYSLAEIQIGSHCVISQRSYLCTGSHDPARISFDMLASPIQIEDQVWLAADVFVAPGIQIGAGSVVGARSTVLENLPGGKICFGNPAKPVRDRRRFK